MVKITEEQLKDIIKIIDISCQRGAFKAIEMEGVGKLYITLLEKLKIRSEEEKNNVINN